MIHDKLCSVTVHVQQTEAERGLIIQCNRNHNQTATAYLDLLSSN